VDKLWEAGRFIYLTHFAMALLAWFGVATLLEAEPASQPCFQRLSRLLAVVVAATALGIGIPVLWKQSVVIDAAYLSLIILIATWAIFSYVARGHRGFAAQFLLIAVIMWDLFSFNWGFQNRMEQQRAGEDHMEEMRSIAPVASFLKSQPGPFRSNPDADFSPRNMGDAFAFETTAGYGATMLTDYLPALFSPMGSCLFNVGYNLGTGKTRKDETPIFESGQWKVYAQPNPCPRAWVVNRTMTDSALKVQKAVQEGAFDPRSVAYLSEPLEHPLEHSGARATQGATQEDPDEASDAAKSAAITYGRRQPDEFELDAELSSSGLLVISEVYYPGWIATVNGQPAHIYKVDSILRGLLLSPGRNHIVMQYRPMSIHIGAILSAIAFLFTFIFAAFAFRRR
jgi:hypothetical protein